MQNMQNMQEKYYIFRIDWSQSDYDMRVVKAKSQADAEAHLKRHGDHGPRYVTCYGSTDKIIEVK
jgi:hypothetical protein